MAAARCAGLVASLGIVLAVGDARADVATAGPPAAARVDAVARQRTARAAELYRRGDFAGASDAYREAYRLRPSPGVLFNLGQSYRQDGRCVEAAGAYRAVLQTDLDGAARDLAAQQLDAVEVCIRALDRSEARRHRAMRRTGLITMSAGGAALVVASGLALADRDRRTGETSTTPIVLAIGGGAAVATGAIMYGVAQHQLRSQRQRRPSLGVWKVPVGTHPVAGATWRF